METTLGTSWFQILVEYSSYICLIISTETGSGTGVCFSYTAAAVFTVTSIIIGVSHKTILTGSY